MSTRFARVVQKIALWGHKNLNAPSVWPEDAQRALQREHTAVRRKVKTLRHYGPNFRGGMSPCDDGEWINADDLLAWLDERGR